MERAVVALPDSPIISAFAWRHWGKSLEDRHIRYPYRDSNSSSRQHADCARIDVLWRVLFIKLKCRYLWKCLYNYRSPWQWKLRLVTDSYDSNFLSDCWGGRGFTPGLWRLGTCNLIPQASHFLQHLRKVNALDRGQCVSVVIITRNCTAQKQNAHTVCCLRCYRTTFWSHISTVTPRLTKIISSGITFVSRNVISRKFL